MTSSPTTTDPAPVPRPWRRWLRVAWTVFFAVLTVALCVLWVRSYTWRDDAYAHVSTSVSALFSSEAGKCAITIGANQTTRRGVELNRWQLHEARGIGMFPFNSEWHGWIGLDACWHSSTQWGLFVPHWFLVLFLATVAALPWLPFRFSLRTMLIATTLVAAAMGAVVWSMSN